MGATNAFELFPPTEEDLKAATEAWAQQINVHELSAGSGWWRVVRADSPDKALERAAACFPAEALNRFTPIRKDDAIVPSAYAGGSREVALWEVVLRSIRHEGIRRIPTHEVRNRYLVQVKTARKLKLLDLRRPKDANLVSPGKRPPDLKAAWTSAYNLTRAWAQQLYERIPDLDGLIYESHQVPGDCIVLFQSNTATFATVGSPMPVWEKSVRDMLNRETEPAQASVDFGDLPETPE